MKYILTITKQDKNIDIYAVAKELFDYIEKNKIGEW